MLAQFARAGLRDPTLIRLDMDSKVSEQLCLGFFHVRSGNKNAALLYLLREVRAPGWLKPHNSVILAFSKLGACLMPSTSARSCPYVLV